MKKQIDKLWGSAFSQKTLENVVAFTAGKDVHATLPADYQLLLYDIWGNKAHCLMLKKQKIINSKEAQKILTGLDEIEKLAAKWQFFLDPAKEDVHTNIESWLTAKYGIETAGKLHTARSRNDQCNLDTRLYLKDQVLNFIAQTISLCQSLIGLSIKYQSYLVPGFTHHQHAMVTTFGHILQAFAAMLVRDGKKLSAWLQWHNTSPLGNMVSYGTTFPIDQLYTAKLLGFDAPDLNSLDEITNRWEAEADLVHGITSLMNHLSLIAETLIIFGTPQFGMIKLADQYSTGSSIMPQKKNPDPLEVVKGKASYAAGLLQGLVSIGKANFIGFNRDSQWTKYMIMDMVNECLPAPAMMQALLESMQANKAKMETWCHKGFIGATTLMELMAAKYHLPLRIAKIIIEKAVKYSKMDKVDYNALVKALAEEKIKLVIKPEQVDQWQDPATIIKLTKSFGGPGAKSIAQSNGLLSTEIASLTKTWKKYQDQIQKAKKQIVKEINKVKEGK